MSKLTLTCEEADVPGVGGAAAQELRLYLAQAAGAAVGRRPRRRRDLRALHHQLGKEKEKGVSERGREGRREGAR